MPISKLNGSGHEKPRAMDGYRNLLPVRLLRLTLLLNARQSELLRKTAGIGLTEWRVLFLLHYGGGSSVSELRRISAMDAGLISRSAARLQFAGLISVDRPLSDRRRRRLRLTRKGERLYQKIAPVVHEWRRPVLEALTSAERRALESALEKMERAALENNICAKR